MKADNIIGFLTVVHRAHPAGYRGLHGYKTLAEFHLKHGQPFAYQPLPKRFLRREPKQCFRNAARLAQRWPDLTYCEGYAMGVIPVEHAWVVDVQGRVIETTWENGYEYFGIPIKTEYLQQRLATQECYGLINCWKERWPMLKDKPEQWRKEIAA